MGTVLIIIHVIVCVALIMIVLLQTGKGADMGAAFGGGSSQTLFGSSGASTFLTKATTCAAVIFMLTSLTLAYRSSHRASESIIQDTRPPMEQPVAPTPDPIPENAPQPTSQPEAPPTDHPLRAGRSKESGKIRIKQQHVPKWWNR
jgi:preprotein translocase subunit SecG